jgi:replicative DNA helicase
MNNNELPPIANLDAEAALLQKMLLDNDVAQSVMETLKAKHFYDPRNALIFDAMTELVAAYKTIDVVRVKDELRGSKQWGTVGHKYLRGLLETENCNAPIEHFLEMVVDKSLIRELIEVSTKIVEDAYGPRPRKVVRPIADNEDVQD